MLKVISRVGRYYDISSKLLQYPLAIWLLHVINLSDNIVWVILIASRDIIVTCDIPFDLNLMWPTTWPKICSLCMRWKDLDLRNLLQSFISNMPYCQVSETEFPGLYNEIRDSVVRPQLKEADYFFFNY